jgi:hypothetical protein
MVQYTGQHFVPVEVTVLRQASCCCGDAIIGVEGDAEIHGICHCDDCRRRTGSAFGWSAYFRDDQIVRKAGTMLRYTIAGNEPQERHFCARCGSTLFWKTNSPRLGGLTGIAGGNFIEPPLPEPKISFRSNQKCGWVTLPSDWRIR